LEEALMVEKALEMGLAEISLLISEDCHTIVPPP